MTTQCSVECRVQGLRSEFREQHISFNTGTELSMVVSGRVGPQGISTTAADLLDFAAAVYQIERQLAGRQRTNPPARFELRMQLRNPQVWNDSAINAARDILHLLGNAVWDLDFGSGLQAPIPAYQQELSHSVTRVVLLSGGVDSTCGAATLSTEPAMTQLVSFYTRQKSLQKTIASELGYTEPSQWRMIWAREPGRGRSFFYRSFLFLSLAAVIAESWGTREILQFENGVLAMAIPPASSWMMTKHAHPLLHKSAVSLFSTLFGGDWQVLNPFLLLTKRGCVQQAIESIGESKTTKLLKTTETCWYHWSNRIIGGDRKVPSVPCGVCIPCIVRRTAISDEVYAYDLCQDDIRNDPKKGSAFRSYFGFLDRVIQAGSLAEFYNVLPAAGRNLIHSDLSLSLTALHQLFLDFAREFMHTYHLDVS